MTAEIQREISGILQFLKEIERMKNVTRTAWTTQGKQESAAEHSWRLSVFAWLIEDFFPDADFSKVVKMCLIHDLGEAIEGDISATIEVDAEVKSERELKGVNQVLEPLPDGLREKLFRLWSEYAQGSTLEARIAKAIDKMETIIQHNQGKNPADFDYEFNLGYGRDYARFDDVIQAIRGRVDRETEEKVSSNLSNSAKRVQDYLTSRGFSFEVKELPGSTRTAKEAAQSVGCEVAQIAKSLVFREKTTDRPILVIASGSNRVDLRKIKTATGLKLGRADGNFVKDQVGFAIGGIPPVGHNEQLETLLDQDLKQYEVIWAAAGTPFAVFQLKPDDLDPLTRGRWMDLSE